MVDSGSLLKMRLWSSMLSKSLEPTRLNGAPMLPISRFANRTEDIEPSVVLSSSDRSTWRS